MSARMPGRRPVPAEHAEEWAALIAEFGGRWDIRTALTGYRAVVRDCQGTPIPFDADSPGELAQRLRNVEWSIARNREAREDAERREQAEAR